MHAQLQSLLIIFVSGIKILESRREGGADFELRAVLLEWQQSEWRGSILHLQT